MSVTQRTCPGCKQQGPLGNPRPGTVQLVWGRGGPAPGRHPSGDQALGVGEGHRPCSQDHALGRGTAPSEPRRDPPPAVGPSAATGVPGREAWLRAGLRLGSRPPGWNRGSLSPNRGLWVSPSFSSWKKAQDRVLGPLLTSHRELVSDLAPPQPPRCTFLRRGRPEWVSPPAAAPQPSAWTGRDRETSHQTRGLRRGRRPCPPGSGGGGSWVPTPRGNRQSEGNLCAPDPEPAGQTPGSHAPPHGVQPPPLSPAAPLRLTGLRGFSEGARSCAVDLRLCEF